MKTISVKAINPIDGKTYINEILASRIVGWYTRDRYYIETAGSQREAYWTSYQGATTIISIDSGAEYEIAESIVVFRQRLAGVLNGERDYSPRYRVENVCASCSKPLYGNGLQLIFPGTEMFGVFEILSSNPAHPKVHVCGKCIYAMLREGKS